MKYSLQKKKEKEKGKKRYFKVLQIFKVLARLYCGTVGT
jgi:hypothetical protein